MNNSEVVEANTLRMKARIAVRGLGLPSKIKEAVMAAIDAARLPLYKYFKVSKPDTVRAFISKVLSGLGEGVDEKNKEKIELCLQQTLKLD
jgi:hypothetical protein